MLSDQMQKSLNEQVNAELFSSYRFPEIKFHCVIGRRYTAQYDLLPAFL
jgi:ferritin